MPTCDHCGAGVTVDINGYRTSDGEVVCDPCNEAAAAVRRTSLDDVSRVTPGCGCNSEVPPETTSSGPIPRTSQNVIAVHARNSTSAPTEGSSMSELQEAAVSQNCAVCRSPHTVVVVEESADVSADWPATLCEPCWDDIRAVWGDYTTIDEKATQTLEARNDDRQEQLVTDGGQEEAATAQELVERWRDLAGMAALHERDTFNARCEIYAKCADELEEVFLRD